MQIKDSVALVTGANRGLGKAIVEALLEGGAAKVYAATRAGGAPKHARVVPLTIDTGKFDQIAAAAARANDVNLLINNAGSFTAMGILATSETDIDRDLRTNVYGTLAMVKAFLPVLERAQDATIVNILSVAALASFPPFGGYAASKAAAYSMTQALRAELRAKRIAVLAALPGPIDTDMVKHVPMPKASAADVASGVLAGIARGDEEIFPDPMAQQMGALWANSYKDFERALASVGG